MNKQPFKLPPIKSYEVDLENTQLVIEKMQRATNVFTFFKNEDNEYQFYFSGFGEDELAMLLILMDKNQLLFDFLKSAVVNTELYRIDELEGFRYTATLIEYIKNKSK